jgi:hypothetical protein
MSMHEMPSLVPTRPQSVSLCKTSSGGNHSRLRGMGLRGTHLRALEDEEASAPCLLGDEADDSLCSDGRGKAPMPCA